MPITVPGTPTAKAVFAAQLFQLHLPFSTEENVFLALDGAISR